MSEKSRTNYYPESQKKYAQANKEKRYRNQRKSSAKRFINEDATLEELNELQALIKDRRKEIMESVDFINKETIIAIAQQRGWRDETIEHQLKTNGIVIYEPDEWVEEQKGLYTDDDERENWFENIGVESWDDLLEKLEAGKLDVIENGIENGVYMGKPFVMVTPL